jgi:hypothetical protein
MALMNSKSADDITRNREMEKALRRAEWQATHYQTTIQALQMELNTV